MSITPYVPPDSPGRTPPTPFEDAVSELQAAIFRAHDAMRRGTERLDFSDLIGNDVDYAERQFLLATQAIGNCGFYLQLIRREMATKTPALSLMEQVLADPFLPMSDESATKGGA